MKLHACFRSRADQAVSRKSLGHYALTHSIYPLGTADRQEIPWKAMESVFKYFQNQELDFGRKKNEVGK